MGARFLHYVLNGQMSHRSCEPDYVAGEGEVIFDHDPGTPEQLAKAFPNYAALMARSDTLRQIGMLEASVTSRRMREAAIGADGGWLAKVDQQIADLRKGL